MKNKTIELFDINLMYKGDIIVMADISILGHFQDEDNKDYVVEWIDEDVKRNLTFYLVYQTDYLRNYISGEVGAEDLIQTSNKIWIIIYEGDMLVSIEDMIFEKINENYLPDNEPLDAEVITKYAKLLISEET